jgi:RNase P protein component
MILKQHKLKLRKERDFFNLSKRYYSSLFTAFYLKYKGVLKTTVVVPKKIATKAFLRVKIKRKTAVELNNIIKNTKSLRDIKLVLVVKKELVDLIKSKQFKTVYLNKEIKALFKKIM